MGLFNILFTVFVVLVVIMTFISEPKVSREYFKAMGKSAMVIVDKVTGTFAKYVGTGDKNETKKEV